MKSAVLVAALLTASGTQAEMYKCVVNGKPTYSDVPCAVDAEKIKIQPAAGAGDESRAWVYRLISLKKVGIGMTRNEVISSWGKPDRINKSIYAYGTHEQWVYDGPEYRNQYVHFENGIVTSISD